MSLIAVSVALALSGAEPSAEPPNAGATTDAPAEVRSPWRTFVELPVQLSAVGTTSKVETALLSAAGVRVGTVDVSAGGFVGGDVALLVGLETNGTAEVSVTRVPAMVEGRGLAGGRFRGGIVSLAGYGYGGVTVGAGFIGTTAYDDSSARPLVLWAARAGGGVEFGLGPAQLRVEAGAGVRDARLEVHGALALGGRW